jgi:ribonuclease PH
VLTADGGTRTAAITGGCLALWQAADRLVSGGQLKKNPVGQLVAGVSVGICDGETRLDLDYTEDVSADVDMNIAALEDGNIVEVQGTAEGAPFSRDDLDALLDLARTGVEQLLTRQREAIETQR